MKHHDVNKLLKGSIFPKEYAAPSTDAEKIDFNRESKLIDERSQAEDRLRNAIAHGNEKAAIDAFMEMGRLIQNPEEVLYTSSMDTFRDYKNTVQGINTMFRLAVQDNHVHPIYVHKYSSRFVYRIESAGSYEDMADVIYDMVCQYCRLVREYSLADKSSLVRDAVTYIQINLCGPLSTRDIAQHLNVTSNLLGIRFKEEMHAAIMDYIRTERIKRARKLLQSTDLSIQEVAAHVGIDDAGYFTKQFRRETGMTPRQYRAQKKISADQIP